MKTQAKNITVEIEDLNNVRISFTASKTAMEEMPDLSKPIDVEMKVHRKKRSLNANAYFWTLCGKIAERVGTTKEEVYRRAVHDAGKWEIYTGAENALKRLAKAWRKGGIGYQSELLDSGAMVLYYGSSEYDSKEMAKLIDWVVDEAQDMGIDTSTPNERSLLLQAWKEEHG